MSNSECIIGFSLLKAIGLAFVMLAVIIICGLIISKTKNIGLKILLGIISFICFMIFGGVWAVPGLKIVSIKK